ncbi:unnamed protein product [Adineta steineri]|uniref:Uncharacterized protein n=1 Tax=Adineta steineri TaxID=433720 RepID=A0A818VGU5_9BILA|nr:unnamed protein product [Adineta steineri]CAF3711950.1 unnamed protein product [Adineta steineri]
MQRAPSVSESEARSVTSRASELSILNDDECKRILSVVERDFKLRQKEYKRLDDIKKVIRQESERVQYLAGSKDFNLERCIRCFKPFRIFFNPKEPCSECKLFVCHECATYAKETKTWACKSCLELKKLEVLTSDWFYFESSKKHKRCGSAKIVRELHKREKELELYHDGRLTSWKVRGQGDVLSVRLTWFDPDHRNTYIKAKARQHLADLDEFDDDLGYGTLPTQEPGAITSFVTYDTNVKRELKEYSLRLSLLVEKLQADLSERNIYNNHRTVRDKIATIIRRGGKEGLKAHQQQITTEVARARVALSGPLRPVLQVLYALQTILVSIPFVAIVTTLSILILIRFKSSRKPIFNYTGSHTTTNTTHERDLQNLLIQQTEEILKTNLQQFHKTLIAPNSSINTDNFDQKLAQAIFDKCVSKEIFQELPDVVDASAPPPPPKPSRQASNTSSLTSLTKPSTSQPNWSNSSSASWEIKSRNDSIRRVLLSKRSGADEEEDTIKEDDEEEEQQHIVNGTNHNQPITTTESIEFDNGLKVDLSSIDDETSNPRKHRRSIDPDLETINRSKARVGDWQTNFTLFESKSSHSGDETTRSNRDTFALTLPVSDNKNISPRIGDKPLEDLADDDLYADDESSSYPIPINTITIGEQSQISDNESTVNRKTFPLPANLLLQNHSSCSFRRPSYTYESDNESIISSSTSLAEMKTFIDEEKFRMDPNITDPKFILRPKDTNARLGETARFKTKIQGTEPIDVFWFRFGTDDELINDEKYQLSHDNFFHYLKIFSTTKEDEGAYLCVIANDKTQNVDMVKLSVKDNKRSFTKPTITQEFSDMDVNEGSSLTLRCKLDQGYPKARVLWYKENTLIQPNGHYKLYYYGDGQHALHVDEATIEDDNGTFTCLALNAAGRVQITADVFVHEKEVIDIPRESSVVINQAKLLRKQQATREDSVMNAKEHNDDSPPKISPPPSPLRRPAESDDEQHNAKVFMDKFRVDRSSKFLENWQNLYEASVNSLEADDDELRHPIKQKQPFFLDRPVSIEQPPEESPRSPIIPSQANINSLKSKWEIRLPELLNTTVGPDRQRRDSTRRHTTNIVFQQTQQQSTTSMSQDKEFNPLSQSFSTSPMLNGVDGERPLSPLVKQLKQKFDRMSTNNSTNEFSKSHSQSQIPRVGNYEADAAYPLLPVASLTCRGLTSNNIERPTQKIRAKLPIRSSTEQNSMPSTPTNNRDDTVLTNSNLRQKGNLNSPIRTAQSLNNQLSTTSAVQQVIGGGATLVYDSLTPNNILPITTTTISPLLQHQYYPNHHYQQQRKEHVRTEQTTASFKKLNLTNINNNINNTNNKNLLILTGRNSSHNTKLNNTKNENQHVNDDDNESNQQQKQKKFLLTKDSNKRSTPLSDNSPIPAKSMQTKSNENSFDLTFRSSSNLSDRSSTPLGRKSVLARAELWDRRISTNENDTNDTTLTCDIEQWSSEFEKIQNQN